MKGRLSRAAAALRQNRGSGIVLILVTMLFVMLLGATLLYTSYTAYLVRLNERAGNRNFYNAETVMNEIVAGVQQTASDAIADAYTQVLVDYSSTSDHKTAFQDAFLDYMMDGRADSPIEKNGMNYQYRAEKLWDYASAPGGASFTVNGYSGGDSVPAGRVVISSVEPITVTLKDVSVIYTDGDYQTSVTTDICVAAPDYYSYSAEYTATGLPDYALIAKTGLDTSSDCRLAGSAYAGQVTAKNGTLTMDQDSTLISGSLMSLSDGAVKFVQNTGCSLWAGGLRLGSGSTATLNGKTFIQNDLELGRRATANLHGDYYGFGLGADTRDETVKAGQSSAILINDINAVLDVNGARRLFLAGNSFISGQGTTTSNTDILMGQSLATKIDQQFYLVPDSELEGMTSNPQVMESEGLDLTTLSAKSGRATTALAYPLGSTGKSVVYLFMKFSSIEEANSYFEGYFANNKAKVQEYLDKYVTISGQVRDGSFLTRGWVCSDVSGAVQLRTSVVAWESMADTALRWGKFYSNLSTTLTTQTSPDTAGTNPYDYYVDSSKITADDGGSVEIDGETCSWKVTSGSYEVKSASEPQLIIAGGNVRVSTDYQGLILCGGTIQVDRTATITSGKNASVLLGKASKYLRNYGTGGTGGAGQDKENWSMDQLVYYRNWNKH